MKTLPVIGLTGPAGVGKDTVGLMLCLHYGFVKHAFAKPIKDMLCAIGFAAEDFEDREIKERVIPQIGVSYRTLAQTLGTEWGRSINPDFWLQIAKMRYESLHQDPLVMGMVITDVRFENEAEFVRQHGTLIHICGRAYEMEPGAKAHSSEAGVQFKACDRRVTNDGSLIDLYRRVACLMEELCNGK